MTFRRSLVDLASRPAGAGGSCSSSFCFSRWAPSARLALRATLSPSVRNIQGVIVCLAVIPVSFPLERLEPATGHQPFAGSPFSITILDRNLQRVAISFTDVPLMHCCYSRTELFVAPWRLRDLAEMSMPHPRSQKLPRVRGRDPHQILRKFQCITCSIDGDKGHVG
jgi:hypothetical protein